LGLGQRHVDAELLEDRRQVRFGQLEHFQEPVLELDVVVRALVAQFAGPHQRQTAGFIQLADQRFGTDGNHDDPQIEKALSRKRR
jgi:hypothetical protein